MLLFEPRFRLTGFSSVPFDQVPLLVQKFLKFGNNGFKILKTPDIPIFMIFSRYLIIYGSCQVLVSCKLVLGGVSFWTSGGQNLFNYVHILEGGEK